MKLHDAYLPFGAAIRFEGLKRTMFPMSKKPGCNRKTYMVFRVPDEVLPH